MWRLEPTRCQIFGAIAHRFHCSKIESPIVILGCKNHPIRPEKKGPLRETAFEYEANLVRTAFVLCKMKRLRKRLHACNPPNRNDNILCAKGSIQHAPWRERFHPHLPDAGFMRPFDPSSRDRVVGLLPLMCCDALRRPAAFWPSRCLPFFGVLSVRSPRLIILPREGLRP